MRPSEARGGPIAAWRRGCSTAAQRHPRIRGRSSAGASRIDRKRLPHSGRTGRTAGPCGRGGGKPDAAHPRPHRRKPSEHARAMSGRCAWTLVVLVDQLDELFAADVDAAERAAFAALLGRIAATGRIWVSGDIARRSVRALSRRAELLAFKSGGATYDLAPPGPAELADIVRKPAAAAELVFETDAATRRAARRTAAARGRPAGHAAAVTAGAEPAVRGARR